MASIEKPTFFHEISKGFATAEEADLDQVRRDMRLEQQWLADEYKYQSNSDISEAYTRGELVVVGPSDHYRPIKRLLVESGNTELYQPYLKAGAAKALEWVTGRAHDYLDEYGIDGSNIRYAVTSMVRSIERQQELATQEGKLALPPGESGHSTGWDFDLDSSSYYLLEDADWKSVSQRDPDRQKLIGNAYEGLLGYIVLPTLIAAPSTYDRRVRHALHLAMAEYYSYGVISPVIEYVNSPNEVIHVGVNPHIHER